MGLNFDPEKLEKVEIGMVSPNPWNPKQKDTKEYKNVLKSIKLKGLRAPVVVREHKGGYEIIDGEQRFTAAKELGYKEIYIYNEGEVDEAEAKSLTIWYQQQVPFDQIELASLVTELDALSIELPFEKAEINNFQELVAFDFSQYDGTKHEPGDESGVRTLLIKMEDTKYEVIMNAIGKVKEENECDDARALELICAEYLSGS